MNQNAIQWVAPSPLWAELTQQSNGSLQPAFRVPAILRFATDEFMQDFFNLLATDPRLLGQFRTVRETWRGMLGRPTIPTPKKQFALQLQRLASKLRRPTDTGAKPGESTDATALPNLKLYQPAHMRYYLVSACLTCRTVGLPDRKVDAGKQERVSFVVRRLLSPPNGQAGAAAVECAWVKGQTAYSWQPVDPTGLKGNARLPDDEERLPLFPATFQDDDQRTRRVFAGLIPVGKREAYLAGQVAAPGANGQASNGGSPPAITELTAREILLRKQVLEPWKALISQMSAAHSANATKVDQGGNNRPTLNESATLLQAARERAQPLSWLILLDFAKFLSQYLPDVWRGVQGKPANLATGSQQQRLLDVLTNTKVEAALSSALLAGSAIPYVAQSLAEALKTTEQWDAVPAAPGSNQQPGSKLDAVTTPYTRDKLDPAWPNFLFPLADPEHPEAAPIPDPGPFSGLSAEEQTLADADKDAKDATPNVDLLGVLVLLALAESDPTTSLPQPDIPVAALPAADPLNGLFQIRCVYEQPACGPVQPEVVSDPTEPFEMAGFFDPDAPARPIRIGLPIDTTPAGLRKFDKNTAFIMSDVLCGQVKRAQGMTFGDLVLSVLPWPFHQDLPSGDGQPCKDSGGAQIGMICSLSIPIITICALILLMIMVTLFDIIFSWIPFFMICFPLPGFKAKK
jgi:hypothetical protein